jgi:hypothetical protein
MWKLGKNYAKIKNRITLNIYVMLEKKIILKLATFFWKKWLANFVECIIAHCLW